MEDDGQQEGPSASYYQRHRSPSFRKEEVKALTNIVAKYKGIIFNKSTSSAANHAKDAAWVKIAELFNNRGFDVVRSMDSLKTKWDNMKREARKLSNNLIDVRYDQFDEVTGQIVAMMCEAENNTSNIAEAVDDPDLNVEPVKDSSNDVMMNWNGDENKQSDDSLVGDENENSRYSNRSMNFSPQDCSLLLQCVRQEKDIVFSKESTSIFNEIKNRAWSRITNSYNKLSPQKRSAKMLRTKFTNMKKMAKNKNFKSYIKNFRKTRHKLEDSAKKIKSEPLFEYREDLDEDNLVDNSNNIDDFVDLNETEDRTINPIGHSTLDPLSSVLNADLGLDTINQVENKEVVKLKLDILNYKMETAKLQRRRIESLMQADAADREAKALETSFRLRAARLEAVAAEMKLPPSHPSLSYTPEEARAQLYTHPYHNS